MANVENDLVKVRAGSEDHITFTLLSDGSAIDLSDVSTVTLVMKELSTGTVTQFSTDDDSPLLSTYGDLTNGQVRLSPLSTTFSNGEYYKCYFLVVDNAERDYSFPEDEEFYIDVRNKFTS